MADQKPRHWKGLGQKQTWLLRAGWEIENQSRFVAFAGPQRPVEGSAGPPELAQSRLSLRGGRVLTALLVESDHAAGIGMERRVSAVGGDRGRVEPGFQPNDPEAPPRASPILGRANLTGLLDPGRGGEPTFRPRFPSYFVP
jgi:hypothetical protein